MRDEFISGRAAALFELFLAAARAGIVSANVPANRWLLVEIARFAPRLKDGPPQVGILDQRIGENHDDRFGELFQARLALALLMVGIRKRRGGKNVSTISIEPSSSSNSSGV